MEEPFAWLAWLDDSSSDYDTLAGIHLLPVADGVLSITVVHLLGPTPFQMIHQLVG